MDGWTVALRVALGVDAVLVTACVSLIVVAVAWVLVARRVDHRLRSGSNPQRSKEPPRDIWSRPP